LRFDIHRWWAKTQFNDAVRLRMYRQIAKMLANGLPMLRILEELHARVSEQGRKPNEPFAIVLSDCRRTVQNGRMLSEALEGWAPRGEQMILMAGEQSGRLESALMGVIDVVVAGKRIKSIIVGGMAYPIVVLALIGGYMYLFGTRVIPEFARIVDPTTWKGAAHSLYTMSLLVQNWMLYFVIAAVALIASILTSMPYWRGNLRAMLDRYAPYSIYRLVAGSGFLTAFSALQAAGMTVEKSLMRLSSFASPWLRERLDGALLGVRSGLNCGEALRNAGYDFPSREVIDDLCVYADYKGFDEALKLLAQEWMEEGVERISGQMKLLNGISIALLAIVIAWMVTGFFGIQHEIAAIARGAH